jgi:hypothetical protein
MSVLARATQLNIPEIRLLHSHYHDILNLGTLWTKIVVLMVIASLNNKLIAEDARDGKKLHKLVG